MAGAKNFFSSMWFLRTMVGSTSAIFRYATSISSGSMSWLSSKGFILWIDTSYSISFSPSLSLYKASSFLISYSWSSEGKASLLIIASCKSLQRSSFTAKYNISLAFLRRACLSSEFIVTSETEPARTYTFDSALVLSVVVIIVLFIMQSFLDRAWLFELKVSSFEWYRSLARFILFLLFLL